MPKLKTIALILAAITFVLLIGYARFRYDVWFARWATGVD